MKLLNGLTSNADKLGYIAGILVGEGGNAIDNLISSIQNAAAGQIHAPEYGHIQLWLQGDGKNALLAYLAGIGLDTFNIPLASKFGKPLQKGAVGYAIVTGAIRMFYGMTHSQNKGINIENAVPGLRNAPTVQQAQMLYY